MPRTRARPSWTRSAAAIANKMRTSESARPGESPRPAAQAGPGLLARTRPDAYLQMHVLSLPKDTATRWMKRRSRKGKADPEHDPTADLALLRVNKVTERQVELVPWSYRQPDREGDMNGGATSRLVDTAIERPQVSE